MRMFSLFSVILLAASASSFSIPISRHGRTNLRELARTDRARVRPLQSRTTRGLTTVPATSLAYQLYTANVGVGSPPANYTLVVDIGTANTIVGLHNPYSRTPTSIATAEGVAVVYGIGYNITGKEYLDQVTLAPNLVIHNQSIGDAFHSFGMPEGIDGVLGLGPPELSRGTLSNKPSAIVPTVMNNLASQRLIKQQVLGIYFPPQSENVETNGELTFGGANPSLYEGDITYVAVTKTFPASLYRGFNITSATYGDHTIISESTAGIVDSGTALIQIPNDAFEMYLKSIPGATLDANKTGLIEIPEDSVQYMHPLHFTIGGRKFTLNVPAQLFPGSANTALGGGAGVRYGAVNPMGIYDDQGLDFIFGVKFMERYYTVFDLDSNRIGFATTSCTFAI